MNHPRVYLETLSNTGYLDTIRRGLEWIGLSSHLKPGDTLFIKPNLTFPFYRQGVMTSPECVEALVIALKDYTDKIIVGEADSGGYNRFSIDEVFDRTGVRDLEKKYGVQIVNLTGLPYRSIQCRAGREGLEVPLPTLLLEDVDLFITAPVPKIHMYTQVSVAVKNQWGCIPDPSMRLRLHPHFAPVIHEITEQLPRPIAVVDGRFGLNRSGPLRGDPVELDWLLVADNLYAADLTALDLMGIDAGKMRYLEFLRRQNVLPSPQDLVLNQAISELKGPRFFPRARLE